MKMLIKFREHYIDPEQIEAVLQGRQRGLARCTIRFRSGNILDVDGDAEDVLTEIAEAGREAMNREWSTTSPGWVGQTSASYIRD